jgi:hypothetical protein
MSRKNVSGTLQECLEVSRGHSDSVQRKRWRRANWLSVLACYRFLDELARLLHLAGFGMDDMEIYVTGNQLTMSGERQPPQPERGTWHRQKLLLLQKEL